MDFYLFDQDTPAYTDYSNKAHTDRIYNLVIVVVNTVFILPSKI